MTCNKCNTQKPDSEFNRYGGKKLGLRPECKACQSARHAQYVINNREKIRAKQAEYRINNHEKELAKDKRWRDANREKIKAKNARRKGNISRGYNLWGKYGIGEDEFNAKLVAQGGRCAVCRTDNPGVRSHGRFHVDHDHVTGKVRGLLCNLCNAGLGCFKDDVDRLTAGIEYLRSYR